MPDPDREIYPNAPLKLVAFEIQYSQIPRLESEYWESIYAALKADFPILGPTPRMELEFTPSGTRQESRGHRLMNRQRTQAATLFNGSASLETSQYDRFETWVALIERLLTEVDTHAGIPSVQRLGLRYIDEVALPGFNPQSADDWQEYIAGHLLQPVAGARFPIDEFRASVQMKVSAGQVLNFRFGVLTEPVIDPAGPLRITGSPVGPYFLLDLDSVWTAPEEEYPSFEIGDVIRQIETLHAPVREVFEESVTDALRNWMREEQNA